MIVDVAHGSEMAHDPAGAFGKTVEGQQQALEHVTALAAQGYAPIGIMIEASDIPSPTDPVMPLDVACEGLIKLRHTIKHASHLTTEV